MRWLLIVHFREGGRETFQMAERRIVDEFLASYSGSWWFQEIAIVPDRVVRKFQIANFEITPAPQLVRWRDGGAGTGARPECRRARALAPRWASLNRSV